MAVRTITVRVTGDVEQFQRSMRDVGAQLVKVETQTRNTTQVFTRMRGGLVVLAQEAIGRTVPGFGSLASAVSALGLSAGTVAGGLLAVGGIAWAIRKIGEDGRRTKVILEELGRQAFKLTPRQILEDQELAARAQLEKARGRLETAQRGISFLGRRFVNPREVAEAKRGVEVLQAEVNAFAIQMAELDRDAWKPFKKIAEEATKAGAAIRAAFRPRGITPIDLPFGLGTPRELQARLDAQRAARGLREVSPIQSVRGRPVATEQIVRDMARAQAAAQSMAESVAAAFESWVTGAQKAKDAVRDMVTSILRDLLRLVVQRAIVDPLAGAFLGAISGSSTTGGSRAVVVNQSVNFAISAIDGPGVASLLQQQSGTIAQIVGDAARRSTGFRTQLVHG